MIEKGCGKVIFKSNNKIDLNHSLILNVCGRVVAQIVFHRFVS